jgi:CheY-like chemotaxis protein/HPt (histidine-containing phosphotransfer) domain-containing protein
VRAIQTVIDPAHVSGKQAQPQPRAVPAVTDAALSVLVVEDNAFNQKVAAMKLERWGHRVRVAGSGAEALAALDAGPFDVMFTDVQMPDMDGFELTAAVRVWAAATGRHLPVIAMTAHAMKGVRERCLAAGMDDYVSKPIRDDELLAAIERVCPANRDPAQDTFGHRLQDTAQLAPPVPAPFDEAELLSRVGGNRDVLRGLIDVFYQDCNTNMAGLKEAVRTGDVAAVKAAAHTVKGMVAFFEAKKAVEAAARLEQAAARDEMAAAPQLVSTLSQELARIEAALATFSPAPDGWHLGLADGSAADSFSFAEA